MYGRTAFPDRVTVWNSWYNNSFLFKLTNNQSMLEKEQGIFLNPLLSTLVGPEGWTEEATSKAKGQIQHTILKAIKMKHLPDPQIRLRS